MKGEHRFLHTQGGVTAFAVVALESWAGEDVSISWLPGLERVAQEYGEAIGRGIETAMAAHLDRDGTAQHLEIQRLVHSPVDTKSDAVECAAALAAWASWGHPQAESKISFESGRWIVRFDASANR